MDYVLAFFAAVGAALTILGLAFALLGERGSDQTTLGFAVGLCSGAACLVYVWTILA